MQSIDFLKSASTNHLGIIQYVYLFLFPKVYNRTNRFGINNNSHFDFVVNNWKHCQNNIVLPTPTKNRVVQRSTRKNVEIDVTQQQRQQQQQQKQQHE